MTINKILYALYLRTPYWQERRRRILKRANYKCEWCRKSKPLDVHHTTYVRMPFQELDSDLVAVCRTCHKKLHAKRK